MGSEYFHLGPTPRSASVGPLLTNDEYITNAYQRLPVPLRTLQPLKEHVALDRTSWSMKSV